MEVLLGFGMGGWLVGSMWLGWQIWVEKKAAMRLIAMREERKRPEPDMPEPLL